MTSSAGSAADPLNRAPGSACAGVGAAGSDMRGWGRPQGAGEVRARKLRAVGFGKLRDRRARSRLKKIYICGLQEKNMKHINIKLKRCFTISPWRYPFIKYRGSKALSCCSVGSHKKIWPQTHKREDESPAATTTKGKGGFGRKEMRKRVFAERCANLLKLPALYIHNGHRTLYTFLFYLSSLQLHNMLYFLNAVTHFSPSLAFLSHLPYPALLPWSATVFLLQTADKLVKQFEFYFSDSNLPNDKFLKQELADNDGWARLSVLGSFQRVKAIETDLAAIAEALKTSTKLEVSEDALKVRRTAALADNIDLTPQTIFIKGLDAAWYVA